MRLPARVFDLGPEARRFLAFVELEAVNLVAVFFQRDEAVERRPQPLAMYRQDHLVDLTRVVTQEVNGDVLCVTDDARRVLSHSTEVAGSTAAARSSNVAGSNWSENSPVANSSTCRSKAAKASTTLASGS
jgi:hypothetical protein